MIQKVPSAMTRIQSGLCLQATFVCTNDRNGIPSETRSVGKESQNLVVRCHAALATLWKLVEASVQMVRMKKTRKQEVEVGICKEHGQNQNPNKEPVAPHRKSKSFSVVAGLPEDEVDPLVQMLRHVLALERLPVLMHEVHRVLCPGG